MDKSDISVKPIGIVRNDVKHPRRKNWETVISEIEVEDHWQEALDQIEQFSHIIVVFWMHRVPASQRLITKVHPQGRPELPLVGVFASRSPMRPNPLGVTTAKLLLRRKNTLRLIGLDAVDGTPVLDIKPYLPNYDCPTKATTPDWAISP